MKKWISLISIPILCIPLLFNWQALEVVKLKTFDALVQTPEPSNNFVILDITEEDVSMRGGWPFPRQDLARIHLDLIDAGAWGVGWVVAFPQEDRFGGDTAFAKALAGTPSVLAMFENDNGSYPPTIGTVILGDGIPVQGVFAQGVIQNTSELANASSQGLAVARTEVDNLVRRLPLLLQTPSLDGWVPAFGMEVMKILSSSDTYVIRTSEGSIIELT